MTSCASSSCPALLRAVFYTIALVGDFPEPGGYAATPVPHKAAGIPPAPDIDLPHAKGMEAAGIFTKCLI
jgi:hypothetical protein